MCGCVSKCQYEDQVKTLYEAGILFLFFFDLVEERVIQCCREGGRWEFHLVQQCRFFLEDDAGGCSSASIKRLQSLGLPPLIF